MSSLRIEDDELRRRRDDDYGMNVGQMGLPPGQGTVPGGDDLSFSDKYGVDSVFGVDPDQVQAPTFQTSGAQAGSSAGATLLPTDNNGGSSFSIADALQMDNLPVASTAAPVQTPDLSSGLTATGDTEGNGPQGGSTDGGANNGGHPNFGAGDVMDFTGGGLTSASPRFSLSPELPAFGAPTDIPSDDATLNPTPPPTDPDNPEIPPEGNPDNVNDPANNGGITDPADNDDGTGAPGQDGTGKTPEQLAQEEAERQAQLQQQRLLEEQRQAQLLQQQGGN